ncbi:MAG: urease accessory protein UreD [Verrucomicrobia bacterium]|nr:urease accessory protein UreD [Verrucomicrobiota bacterium]
MREADCPEPIPLARSTEDRTCLGTGPRGVVRLEVAEVFEQSTLTEAYSSSPLRLLTPRSRGLSVWGYLSNLGGGLVAGDQTHVSCSVGRNSRCFLGTQSSTKIYRNPEGLPCQHQTVAAVASGGLLVWAPDPVQAFAESIYAQRQKFLLAPGASLVLLDWFTSGRMARGERWQFHCLQSRNEVWESSPEELNPTLSDSSQMPLNRASPGSRQVPQPTGGSKLLFLDSLFLDSRTQSLNSPCRLGRFNCVAFLLLLGPMVFAAAESLVKSFAGAELRQRSPTFMSVSPREHGALLRIAGERTLDVANALHTRLSFLAPLLGDHPWMRRF